MLLNAGILLTLNLSHAASTELSLVQPFSNTHAMTNATVLLEYVAYPHFDYSTGFMLVLQIPAPLYIKGY